MRKVGVVKLEKPSCPSRTSLAARTMHQNFFANFIFFSKLLMSALNQH